ncbi:PRP38 family-domain-containing protein, partial [Scheffersomyces coipomensis]|uniref:PRP38 family-domain-containing protein n=1 Tax=Scheffersomyces coipomensis TaxID=1788519 RepID=UPI00315DE8E6
MTDKASTKKQSQPSYNDKRNVTNKAYLIEPIIRHRIQDSIFYKQYLYLTNEATILPIIIDHVKFIGGTDSIGKSCQFLSCLFRLLELDPSQEIIDSYLTQLGFNEFKYLTALILIYIRITYNSSLVYSTFDKFGQDFRKLRIKLKSPEFNKFGIPINFKLTYMDEWIDDLLVNERVVNIILPRLTPRITLVENGLIEPKQYHHEKDEEEEEEEDDGDDNESDIVNDANSKRTITITTNNDNEPDSDFESDS